MRRILTALVMTLPAAAFAQETVGAMSGTLEGEQVAYSILSGEDHETGWRETDDGIEVTLDAYPADSPVSDEQGLLRIVFTADSASTNPQMRSAEASLNRDGTTLTAGDDAVDMVLDSLEVSGEGTLLVGNVRATLSEGDEDVSVVSPEGVAISYDIQANLFRQDGE